MAYMPPRRPRGGRSFFPFGGPPGQPPFSPGPPGQPPGTSGPSGAQAPSSPPPQFVPAKPLSQAQAGAFAVDPGAIRRCMFRYTYVWLTNGDQFWFYPIFVGRDSVAGFRWNGFFWMYFGIDLRRIDSFTCF
ncbi:transporter [Paenibacillus guangzhouensis]|uniref:transporter n=1 Tax=Paenibacillus guangzhouensis TaxID=1473112 RepID=UPI00126782C1|nr:transporter [Paenibacillus guangzhouensis]